MKKYIVLAVIIAIAAIVIYKKYEYIPSKPNPTRLIDDLISTQSEIEVNKKLSVKSYKMEVDKKSTLPKDDKRPRYDISSFNINGYRHLEEEGKLQLLFFNDRLMSSSFYPSNYTAFLQKISANTHIDFIKDKKNSIFPNTDLSLREDPEQKDKYLFRWEDKALSADYVNWTLRYAH